MIDHPIVAVETGCSFAWDKDNIQYLSTPNIIKYLVAPTDGILYSLDINYSMIDICRSHMEEMGLSKYVKFLFGDSVDCIRTLWKNKINFVWLDSAEDALHAQSEYSSIQPFLDKKHLICVDDYGCPNSVKWQGVSKIIKDAFDSYETYDTPTGLIVGYRK